MSRASTVRFVPWEAKYLKLLRLASADWTPPTHLRTVANPARTRLRVEGTFVRPDGTRVKVSTRLKRPSVDLPWEWVADQLDLKMKFHPKVVA